MRKMFNEKEKWCNRCKKWLSHSSFGVSNRVRDVSGRQCYCTKCSNEYSKIYYTTEKRQKYMLKHRYGITKDWFDKKFSAQKGRCVICNRKGVFKGKETLVVDHCHKTGKARGLLCQGCNIVLGFYKDDVPTFKKIIKYLKK